MQHIIDLLLQKASANMYARQQTMHAHQNLPKTTILQDVTCQISHGTCRVWHNECLVWFYSLSAGCVSWNALFVKHVSALFCTARGMCLQDSIHTYIQHTSTAELVREQVLLRCYLSDRWRQISHGTCLLWHLFCRLWQLSHKGCVSVLLWLVG